MSAYLIASYDIEDPETHEHYALSADPLLEKHGGEILVADGEAKAVEGNGGRVGVVVKFESEAAAMNFYNDPDYRPLKKMRLDSTKNGMVVLATARNSVSVAGQEP